MNDEPETLETLFPGRMGRVHLTRVAIRAKRPDLLKMPTDVPLEVDLTALLQRMLEDIKRG